MTVHKKSEDLKSFLCAQICFYYYQTVDSFIKLYLRGKIQVFGIEYLQTASISSSCNNQADCSKLLVYY